MSFNVGEPAAYVVLFIVLGFFTLLAIVSTGIFTESLPSLINDHLVLRKKDGTNEENASADFFLSARNSASATQIAFSVFASGMGAWIFYGPTEMGATPAISWLGVLGYSIASASPTLIAFILGPVIKARCNDSSFNIADFGRQRYGYLMQGVIALMSIFYMFIYLVAEMTSISNIYSLIGNSEDSTFTTSIAIICGIITIFYTSFGGLPASIITDKFQAVMVMILALILVFALSLNPDNKIPEGNFDLASNFTNEGLMAFVTLVFAIISAEMFNLSTWQRVWAAKSESDMKKGFVVGSALIFLLMMFFGVMGMVAYSLDPEPYDNFDKFAFLAFFDILAPLEKVWHIITLILVTSLAASTIDSLQNALMSPFSNFMIKAGWNSKWLARILIVLINIPAIVLSAKRYNVINLFLVADLVCATAVLPVFLGLMTENKLSGLIPAPTELGAVMGCVSGIVTICVIGRVYDAPGGLFEYFWLPNEGICALCGSKTMVTFIVTPFSSGLFCLIFSKIEILIRGNEAHNSLFSGNEVAHAEGKAMECAPIDNIEAPIDNIEDRPEVKNVVDDDSLASA